jgi:hypothetical protein
MLPGYLVRSEGIPLTALKARAIVDFERWTQQPNRGTSLSLGSDEPPTARY